ncbi:MAG: S24/S26 family peptidase [Pseudomonadota bacterium]
MSLFGFTFARIRGDSMEPMLPSGSLALFRARKRVERGDVVLVDHPEFGVIVKRARDVGEDGSVALEGTSPASTSPERLGRVERSRVQGVMVRQLR